MRRSVLFAIARWACGTTHDEPPTAPTPVDAAASLASESPPIGPVERKPAKPEPPRELPFEPSPDDKAAFEVTGYLGVRTLPADAGFAKGPVVAGVKPGGGADKAGMKEKDVIVEIAGVSFAATDDDPLGKLRARLLELPFDSDTQVKVWREGEGVREMTVHLGRRPPPFNSVVTPESWLAPLVDSGSPTPSGVPTTSDSLLIA